MIPNKQKKFKKLKKGWNYLTVKRLSALLKGITSKNNSGFQCLNCFQFSGTKNKLKSHEKVCKNKGFYGIVLPSQKNNTFNQ